MPRIVSKENAITTRLPQPIVINSTTALTAVLPSPLAKITAAHNTPLIYPSQSSGWQPMRYCATSSPSPIPSTSYNFHPSPPLVFSNPQLLPDNDTVFQHGSQPQGMPLDLRTNKNRFCELYNPYPEEEQQNNCTLPILRKKTKMASTPAVTSTYTRATAGQVSSSSETNIYSQLCQAYAESMRKSLIANPAPADYQDPPQQHPVQQLSEREPVITIAMENRRFPAYDHENQSAYHSTPEQQTTTVNSAVRMKNDLEVIIDNLAIEECDLTEYHSFIRAAEIIVSKDLIGLSNQQIEQHINQESVPVSITSLGRKDFRVEINTMLRDYLTTISSYLDPDINTMLRNPLNDLSYVRMLSAQIRDALPATSLRDMLGKAIINDIPGIINYRTIRLLGRNFLRSSCLFTLLKRSINNHLQSTRESSSPHQEKDYIARLNILLEVMKTAKLITGDTTEDSDINYKGMTYGNRGLSFSKLKQWAESDISIERLAMVGYYCDRRLREITTTGNVNLEWMASFTDETLSLLFNQRYDRYNATSEHSFLIFEAIKTIMTYTYNAGFDYNKTPAFFQWVRDISLIAGSDDAIARMLFDRKAEDSMHMLNLAQRVNQAIKHGAGVNDSKTDIEDDIKQFCAARLHSQQYHEVKSQREIINEFNKLNRDDILSYVANTFNTNIIHIDKMNKQLGYHSTSGIYIEGHRPSRNYISITPEYLLPDNASTGRKYRYFHYNSNHTLIYALYNQLAPKKGTTSFKKNRNTDIIIFNFEQEIIEEHSQLSSAGSVNATIQRTKLRAILQQTDGQD